MTIKPSKLLGQHFLKNKRILDKIIVSAEISKDDIVLEIGAGKGNLTKKLAQIAKKVIAVEKDKRLIPELKRNLADFNNVKIMESDILKISKLEILQLASSKLQRGEQVQNWKLEIYDYKVVGNIPYYLTSRLLRTIFEKWPKPKLIVLTVQKEVAQRIVARPLRRRQGFSGQVKMNLLAVSVQYYAEPKLVSYIKKENFYPVPKVDSAIIKLIPKKNQESTTPDIAPGGSQGGREIKSQDFFKVVRAGFSQKRKFLLNNLSIKLKKDKSELKEVFKKIGLDEKVRAENLSLDDWVKLAAIFSKNDLRI